METEPKEDDQLWEDVYPIEENDMHPEEESSSTYFPPGPADRSTQYVPGIGVSRYYPALRNLVPFKKKKKNKNSLVIDESGLLSFFTYTWLSKYIAKAYREGLSVEDIPHPSPQDTCEFNVQRLENLWQDELIKKGPQSASLNHVTWRFVKTRFIVSGLTMCLCIVLGFLSLAFFMRYLLEYAETENASPWTGLQWALLLTLSEVVRITLYASVWAMNSRSAVRLRTAFHGMLYRKILRLHSFQGKSIGELINLFSNDGQRIYDLAIFGPMIIGGPVSVILGFVYVYWILGPWPMLGFFCVFLFYPLQHLITSLGGMFRRKCIGFTDKRLNIISEVLNSIKFVKLYTWAKVFIKQIKETRRKELSFLEKAAYMGSFCSSLAGSAATIAGILTIIIHIIVEKNITASKAFSVVAVFFLAIRHGQHFIRDGTRSIIDFVHTASRFKAFPILSYIFVTMRLYMTYLQYGWSNIIDFGIICKRFKSVMLLVESTTLLSRPLDRSQAICIADGYFACYRNADQNYKYKMKKRKSLTFRRNTVTLEDMEKEALNQPPATNYTEILFDINFFAPKGSLIGICGPVGCGKTSLLSGILGHLCMQKGKLCREGTCAYVSQQAWLLNATVRENILFGEKFKARKYFEAVRTCDLVKDIDSLPGGDNTEIGERGVNLSGGQKQRLALARAVYSERDIYLLDDPLSAVDNEVAHHIFTECILKALRSKTVLFVSHQIQFLNQCNEIVVMKEGRIVERGIPHDLLSRDTEYKLMFENLAARKLKPDLLREETQQRVTADLGHNGVTSKAGNKSKSEIDGILIKEEKTIHGAIKSSTFMSYINACGGICFFMVLVFSMLLNVGTSAFSSWWLHMWIDAGSGNATVLINSNWTVEDITEIPENSSMILDNENSSMILDNENSSMIIDNENSSMIFDNKNSSVILNHNIADNPDFNLYMYVYLSSIAAILLTSVIRGILFTKITLKASSFIHQKLVNKLLKTCMEFFETTPVGRIQNLFSRDIDEVETRLPYTLESLLQGLWSMSFSFLFICLAFPWFLVPLLLISILYFFVHRRFRSGLRELRRLDNSTRSPILSNVSATVQGIDSVHAFGKEQGFIQRFNSSYDLNMTCTYMSAIASRWLALRVDGIAVFIMLISSLLVILMHGSISPSLAGLALAYTSTLCGAIQYTVRLITETEVKLISLERINSYLEYMKEEGGHGPKGVPKETWPELGSIRFQNVELTYREGLDPALKGISFHIRSEEKIGIVGRTGAGKSSIVTALFRLAELSKGSIKIDNLDISNLELNVLRSKMSIIPQDPVLFTGTLRSNLDPEDEFNDEEIWTVIDKMRLRNKLSLSDEKLHLKVGFGGDNLSAGEKQLLCLARALLRKTKILILDEATSGLDHETESVIQNALFAELKYCTVIIIAHRLETVKECHRVLVMDDGLIAEFDEPKSLLQKPDSMFYRMCNASQEADS